MSNRTRRSALKTLAAVAGLSETVNASTDAVTMPYKAAVLLSPQTQDGSEITLAIWPFDVYDRSNLGPKLMFSNFLVQWVPPTGFSTGWIKVAVDSSGTVPIDLGPIPKMYAQIRRVAVDWIKAYPLPQYAMDIKPEEVLVFGGPSVF